jgi:DNA invertase Pin-like site-specific DNA recombinase
VEAGYCSRQEGKDSKRERGWRRRRLNAMMLDMLAAVARKDYEDRRRQAQGIVKAKAAGAYRGRPEDTARNAGIAGMLHSGMSWTAILAGRRSRRSPGGRRRRRSEGR